MANLIVRLGQDAESNMANKMRLRQVGLQGSLTYPYTAWAVTTYWPIYVSQSSGRELAANDRLNNKTSGYR